MRVSDIKDDFRGFGDCFKHLHRMPVYTQWNTNTAAERINVPGQHQQVVSLSLEYFF